MDKVIFKKKSEWQKDDCLLKREGCLGNATEEAIYGIASIRCCSNENCKNASAELAISLTKKNKEYQNKLHIINLIKISKN